MDLDVIEVSMLGGGGLSWVGDDGAPGSDMLRVGVATGFGSSRDFFLKEGRRIENLMQMLVVST